MSSRVVTPEAVVLELPTAGVGSRTFARLIDFTVQMTVMFAAAFLIGPFELIGISPILYIGFLIFVILIVMPMSIEIIWRGRSPGKAIFGLRVVNRDGAPEAPRQAAIRTLVSLVDVYLSLGLLSVLGAMFSERSQRPGDMAAGTVVIRLGPAAASTPIAFHPPLGYEYYVATLDVGSLSDEDFTLIRELLLRIRELTPSARSELTMRCAEAVRLKIRHDLPGPMDPESWLVCVASAYQFRQGGLLADAALGLAPLA